MDSSSRSQAPAQHVRALYPLARVLVGDDEAEALIRRVYEHAAATSPAERPDDTRAWLFELLLNAQDDALEADETEHPPDTECSFTDDPFRKEVAKKVAAEKLPVAFAACSVHERLLLSIDVLTHPSDEVLAQALDTPLADAQSIRDQARSGLRASLRDILNGPERMLVDVALPDDALRRHLRDLLTDRFHPVPPSLQSDVSAILRRARQEKEKNTPSVLPAWLPGWFESVIQALSSARGIASLVLLLVLGLAGIGTVSYFSLRTGPSGPTSLVDLSVRQAASVHMAHPARSANGAAAYIEQAWGRRLSAPTINGASLRGIGRSSLGREEVPVLLYADETSGQQIAAYAFNYALLDRLDNRVVADRSLRTQLASGRLLPRSQSHRAVVLWRQQDDIFVVVGPASDPDALRARIQQ